MVTGQIESAHVRCTRPRRIHLACSGALGWRAPPAVRSRARGLSSLAQIADRDNLYCDFTFTRGPDWTKMDVRALSAAVESFSTWGRGGVRARERAHPRRFLHLVLRRDSSPASPRFRRSPPRAEARSCGTCPSTSSTRPLTSSAGRGSSSAYERGPLRRFRPRLCANLCVPHLRPSSPSPFPSPSLAGVRVRHFRAQRHRRLRVDARADVARKVPPHDPPLPTGLEHPHPVLHCVAHGQ